MLKTYLKNLVQTYALTNFADDRSSSPGKNRAHSRTRSNLDYQSLETRELLAADAVVQWNEIMLDAIRATSTTPPIASRAMAIVHTAIHDTVNSLCNENQAYLASVAAHPKADIDVAVAGAAERTLSALFPTQTAVFQAALNASLSAVPGVRETQGLQLGRSVADLILSARANDGSTATSTYVPGTDPGDWRPTAPAFASPLLPHWGSVQTFAVNDGTQFRAAPIPALSSSEYTANFNEVKELGSATSSTRTADQADIARIWAGGAGTATPPGQWNMIAQEISESKNYSLKQNAKLFALLNIALADAAITCWESKYHYELWRPISAIQLADTDGNSATTVDTSWSPLLTTPPFPAYTSGHSTFSGAASTVLAKFAGTYKVDFTLKSEATGVADRSYSNLWAAAEEAGMSRIYGGIHFQFDNQEGLKSGRAIGDYVFNQKLQKQYSAVANLEGANLYIFGTTKNDNLMIVRSGRELVVRNDGRLVGRFSADNVQNVIASGLHGNDRICVALNVNASSELYGGADNDVLLGGQQRDFLFGEEGNDWMFGRAGDDFLEGGLGINHLFGGLGDDELWGKKNRDRLFGGGGTDRLNWR